MSKKGGKGNLNGADENKLKLEKRVYLAKTDPNPIFDLSDCNLTSVPDGIFSLCKVFRKDALYLQHNQLKSLSRGGPLETLSHLKILDISANKFEKLPSDLHLLESLEVLNVSQNQLQQLPDSIGSLSKLRSLNASNNYLHQLPDSIGNCSKMEVLNLKNNKNLKKLPVTLGKLKYLFELEIDSTIVFPPKEICQEGVQAIIIFLSNEEGNSLPTTSSISTNPENTTALHNSQLLQNELDLHEQQKKKKQMEMLNLEKQIWEDREKEAKLEQEQKKKQERLIKDVEMQQKTMDSKISKVQEEKDIERDWLIKHCLNEEKKSNEVVGKILTANRKLRSEVVDALEWEKKQEEEWLSQTFSKVNFEKKQILIAMDEELKEEVEKVQKVNEEKRVFVIKSLVSELMSQDNTLQTLMDKREQMHAKGVETIRDNEEFQKSAVASLLERSDANSWKLTKQITIIQEELAALTKLELMKKKLQSDSHYAELQKNRISLTEELMNLFKQRAERRKKLTETIRKMETMKDSGSFWMEQYGKLLNSKSHQLVEFLEAVHPNLAHELFLNGVLQFLPLLKDVKLSTENLRNLDGAILTKVGIKNSTDRASILKAVKTFLELSVVKPSAPEFEGPSSTLEKPSAPPMSEANKSHNYSMPDECVVCLERKPNLLFIPCGHICCCEKCCHSLSLCPLCRQPIVEIYETVH